MKNEKKTAEKQAETVTISRAEYEELKLQNQWLLEQLGLAKKRQFGSSSEKMHEEFMDQLGLTFNELEAYAFGTKSATPEQIAVKAHERKRQSGNVLEVNRRRVDLRYLAESGVLERLHDENVAVLTPDGAVDKHHRHRVHR